MTDLTIRKRIEVATPPERAFEVFTSEVGSWWPAITHSLGREEVVDVRFDLREGGRLYEVRADGATSDWGEILAVDPPRYLELTWTVNPERPTHLEIRFAPSAGGTLVELTHSGWEAHADGVSAAASYTSGWDAVLAPYAAVTAGAPAGRR